MFVSVTSFPVVPFASLVCLRFQYVHCCRTVLGPVTTSQHSCWHAPPVGMSTGLVRAVPEDMGVTCPL